MDWFEPLDQYCERTMPGFWAEPLNAVSNAGFIVAAMALFLSWRRSPGRSTVGGLLILNVFVVGVGSSLFHTFANRWSALADVIPITVFILFYLAVALRAFLGMGWGMVVVAVVAFLGLSRLVAPQLEPAIGYTAAYLPALAAIFVVGLLAARRDAPTGRRLLTAGAVFALSCLFRAGDLPLCDRLPAGTHMAWHVLNATTLYLLVATWLRSNGARAAR
jgi:hypothetical protein